MKNIQTKGELAIFGMFAELCPLKIIPASIVNRDPPEPDILCVVGTEEQVAFELVEVIDKDWARLTSRRFRETSSLDDAYMSTAGSQRRALDQLLGNALVYVSFHANARAKQRRAAVAEILMHLSSIRLDFVGDWEPPVNNALHGTVRAIRISRGDFQGPAFEVEAVSAIGDPTVDSIRAKWRKSYASPYRIELLAYYELQPQIPAVHWRHALQSFICDNSDSSPFRRVWLFDVASRTISFSLECEGRRAG